MKYFLLSAILFTSLYSLAQNCNEAALPQTPGAWKEGMKGSTTGVPVAELPKEKKVVATIHNMIKQSYLPKGLEASFTGSYSGLYPDMPACQYYYGIYFMPYHCNGNIIKPDHETNTTLFIHANIPGINFTKDVVNGDVDEADKDHYGVLHKMPSQHDSLWSLGETEQAGGMGVIIKQYQWLVTYDGKLPFLYVSRKEYLDKSLYMLKKLKDKELKSNESENFPDKALRDKRINSTKKYFDERITIIENILKQQSAEDLKKTAIISAASEFKEFTKEDDKYASILVKENPGYYNKKLSKGVPQLFYIEWQVDEKNPVLAQAFKDFMRSFHFGTLKTLLGK
jgi:hypothetical protein